MAHLMNDIKVTYINATGHNDFMLLVFTKNEDVNAIESPYVAWHKIQAQSSATFWYPVNASVGAHWESGGALIRAGPFPAMLGTTWYLTSYHKEDSPNLAQGRCHVRQIHGNYQARSLGGERRGSLQQIWDLMIFYSHSTRPINYN